MRKLVILLPLMLILTDCNLGSAPQPTPDVAAIVNATLTAVAAELAPPVASDGTGGVAGQLSYPAETLPAMRIVAIQAGSGQIYSVETAAGQNTYQLNGLPEGKYNLLAYTLGGDSFPAGLAGGYTQAVMCGLTEACTDHGLVDVIVFGGEITPEVNIFDWLQPNFPPMPGAAGDAAAGVGSIAGSLMVPSSSLPTLRVVAFHLETGATYSVETAEGQNTYQLDNLPAGRYFVVAYTPDGGLSGGYTAAVVCGLSAECADHTLLEVIVTAGGLTQNIVPGDFYAPAGTFPAMP